MIRTIQALLMTIVLIGMAASQAIAEKRVALVIGNSAYENTSPLANPRNDAGDIAAKLEQLGFDVTVGLDLGEDGFLDTISAFSAKLEGAKVALFFYAGHGIQYQNVNYLIPIDAELKSEFRLKRETISLNDIIEQMEARAPVNLVFLDACRNNPLASDLKRGLRSKGRSATIGRGLARIKTSSETLITFAAAPGAEAADGKGRNSPFTAALLKHIETPGVEVEVMLKRVSSDVQRETNFQQAPERLSRLNTEFYFQPDTVAVNPTPKDPPQVAVPPKGDSPREAWTAIKDMKSPGIFRVFIKRYPNSIYSTFAQARLLELEKLAARQPNGGVPQPPQNNGQDNNSGNQGDGLAPPVRLKAGVNGRNVTSISFRGPDTRRSGNIRKLASGKWIAENTVGKRMSTLTETRRDEWSVYLTVDGNPDNVQLDLFTKELKLKNPQIPTYKAIARITAADDANVGTSSNHGNNAGGGGTSDGRSVTTVTFGNRGQQAGSFAAVDNRTWVEKNASGRVMFRYSLSMREKNFVRLYDSKRGVNIELNLASRSIKYWDRNNHTPRVIYQIINASVGNAGTAPQPVVRFPLAGKSWGGVVRSEPSMSGRRLAGLREGQQITLLENTGVKMNGYDWFKIRWNGRTGYQWGGILCPVGHEIPGAFQVCK